jgi:uncharacterized protein with PQ loop repeat
MARLQFEQRLEIYSRTVPSLVNKNEYKRLKDALTLDSKFLTSREKRFSYLPAILMNFVLFFFGTLMILMVTDRLNIENPFIHMGLILFCITAVITFGASGVAFNKINEIRAKNFPLKFARIHTKMVLNSKNYDEYLKLYTKKYYRAFSATEIESEIKAINRFCS